MSWKCPCCGSEEYMPSESRCSCGNEISEEQLQHLQFENLHKKPRTSPALKNASVVIIISIVLSTVVLPFTTFLPPSLTNVASHQASIIGYLFILNYRLKDQKRQIWKVMIWVWLLMASIYSLMFMPQIGTKYTAEGIILGGLKSEILSVIITLTLYFIVIKFKRLVSNEHVRFWKFYFVGVVILCATSVPFYEQTLRIWELIDIAFMIPATLGLFGFAWHKPILKRGFWKVFFLGWVSWTPLYHFAVPLPPETLISGTVSPPQWFIASLTLVIAIPHFIAIFRYAFYNQFAGQSAKNAG